MKMKNAVPELIQNDNAIIASFGNARLMKMPSGHCELVGGSIEDRALAGEWISLFMHELVACTRNPRASLDLPRLRDISRNKGPVALSPARMLD